MRYMLRLAILLMVVSAGTTMAQMAQRELADPLRPAKEQPRIYVGPVGGFNRSLHSSGFQSVAEDVLCPDFTSGTANGYYFGFSGEYLLGKPEQSKSSIIARVVYNYLPGGYEVPGDTLPSINTSGDIAYSEVRHVAEIKYSTIDLEAIYKLNLFNTNFGVVVGPTVGFVMSSSLEQRMEIVSPAEAVFERNPGVVYTPDMRGIITAQTDLPDRSSIRIAVKAGVQYELTAGRILIVPCVYYNFGITEVSPATNLRINALQAGVDIRFAI